ncbi:cation/multidrug efflux pump [Candidatus Pelagadaptatus aseana]|uniref:cation/multidrug efflux pump n=1 Tax=Candidatus Pelagadaptatus aseana TaxID=3120508 RepID=UPI003C700491
MLIVSALSLLVAWDVYRYKEIEDGKSIATISFEQLDDQHFQSTVVNRQGDESVYELKGDQWQLDVRIFKWSPAMASMGFKPGYRLDRLSGRYYSFEKERNAERTAYALNPSYLAIDVWALCQQFNQHLKWLETFYGTAAFVPMSDGALYEIVLTQSGLEARPLNERAQTAVSRWQ